MNEDGSLEIYDGLMRAVDKDGNMMVINEYPAYDLLDYRTKFNYDNHSRILSEKYTFFEDQDDRRVELPYRLKLYEYSDYPVELGYK